MAKKVLPMELSDGAFQYTQPNHRNWFFRHRRVSAAIGALTAVGGLAWWGISHLGGDSAPTIGVHMTLKGCEDGNKDAPPQPMGVYPGQSIILGIGDKTLEHTVTLEMQDGGLFRQLHVDEGVTLEAGANQSTVPGSEPTGVQLTYTLENNQQVTITAHPEAARPAQAIPVDIERSC